mmetsp:Transcript_11075/g.36759  ORF Transcript_11075/g.36759 Transcript_11075/m.36759 type:complete len:232 (+) Transcript_11075:160-855(+)
MPACLSSACSISTWCLVAANTMVCSSFWSKRVSTSRRAAGLSWGRTRKKSVRRDRLSLVSRSRRRRTGSCSDALVKSARMAGSVAENRSVCLDSGIEARMAWIWVAKPISNSRSASSNTTYSTRERESCESRRMCCSRPGVATIASGFAANSANWSSIESPPTSRQKRSLGVTKCDSSTQNLCVCSASSRVGDSTAARTPTVVEWPRSRSNMGRRKAAVLPEPVRAMATTS